MERGLKDDYEQRWLRVVALLPVLAIGSFGAVGLLLADLSWYRPIVVLIVGALVFVGLCACARPLWRREPRDGGVVSTGWGLAAVAVSVMYAIWNGAHAAQHVQINRDGGLYLNTGRWIATHGSLIVHPFVGPFASNHSLVQTSNGIAVDGQTLEFSLSHMLPALLAEAQNLGGDHLMFLTVPILSGLALLAFFVLAARVIRNAPLALAATVCLAFVMPQVSFSRDSTSEIPTQVLVFTAAWLLCGSETWRHRSTALCAGVLLGLVQPLHIDGLAYMLGLPLVCAMVWLDGRRGKPRAARGAFLWLGSGLVAGLFFGVVDLALRDRGYVSSVRGEVESLAGAMVLAIVLAVGIVVLSRRADIARTLGRVRDPLSIAVGISVLALGFGAWFLRPVFEQVHGSANGTVAFVQSVGHLPVDSTRKYAELSVQWVSWYVGPLTLTLAIVALAVLASALVKGSLRFPAKVVTLMLGPPALLYLWQPSITPDHIWAMRRFLPAVFPGVILLVFGAIAAIVRAPRPASARVRNVVAVVLSVCVIGYATWATEHVFDMTEQRGEYAAVEAVCRMLGPKSAVVVLQESSFVQQNDPQTLRSFCNIPVAVMPGKPNGSELRDLARGWRAKGRQLFVVAESPTTLRAALPGLAVRVTPPGTNRHLLNATLLWRPSYYKTESLRFATAPVPVRS